MQRLRLLATSLLASACVLPTVAQALNPQTLSTPQSFTTNSLPSITTGSPLLAAKPGSFHFDSSRDSSALTLDSNAPALHADTQVLVARVQPQDPQLKSQESLLAQTTTSCYTLRVYGFTPQDLKSPHPHSSHETDCTPASRSHLKAVQLPATVNPK